MYQNFYQQGNHYDVIHVNGENGARALQMSPNSNVLLLDDTAPLVWLASTDGAGYKTVTAYDITPHQPEPQLDINALMARLDRIEERLNDKPNTSAAKRKQTESNE